MRYTVVAPDDAAAILATYRRDRSTGKVESLERGAGSAFDVDLLDELADELHALRREMGEPDGGPRGYWAAWEGAAAGIVHGTLGLPPAVATDAEFWLWVVFGRGDQRFIKLVDWRHSKSDEPGGARNSNYGITNDLAEGLFSRLWLRADIAYDPESDDPYELARRGDQDIWRSHIFRQEYGQVRTVARALLRFQYPDADPDDRVVSNDVIRGMAKELRRRHATIAYELLSDAEADELVREVRDSIP